MYGQWISLKYQQCLVGNFNHACLLISQTDVFDSFILNITMTDWKLYKCVKKYNHFFIKIEGNSSECLIYMYNILDKWGSTVYRTKTHI